MSINKVVKYYHLNKKWYYFLDCNTLNKYSFVDKENDIGILFDSNVSHSKAVKTITQLFPDNVIIPVYPFREGSRTSGNGTRSKKTIKLKGKLRKDFLTTSIY